MSFMQKEEKNLKEKKFIRRENFENKMHRTVESGKTKKCKGKNSVYPGLDMGREYLIPQMVKSISEIGGLIVGVQNLAHKIKELSPNINNTILV